MNPATVSLAELVTRGINSMNQNANISQPQLRPTGEVKHMPRDLNDGVEKLLKSTNGLVERLTWMPSSASQDMHTMRRYILRSVEHFISELTHH